MDAIKDDLRITNPIIKLSRLRIILPLFIATSYNTKLG